MFPRGIATDAVSRFACCSVRLPLTVGVQVIIFVKKDMSSCTEFVLDDLLAVTVIPVEDYDPGFADWQLHPVIPSEGFAPSTANAVVIGNPISTNLPVIPLVRKTGKASDSESDAVADRAHTVKVSCEADCRDLSVLTTLLRIERTPSHLLLTFRGGKQGFVQANEDNYVCEVERSDAKTTIQFRIQNIMGIQHITS